MRQADIQLLQYPLTFKFPADVASNDMKLYESSISGPAMTYGMFAVMYMQQHVAGDNFLELAQAEFNKSYGYVYGGFNSFSEGVGGGGTPHFATGMGAFLQSIVQGWAGVRYIEMGITLRPQMPLDGTTNLTVAGIHHRGSALTLSILPVHAQLRLSAGPALHCSLTSPANATVEKVLAQGDTALLLRLGATATCRSQQQKRSLKTDDIPTDAAQWQCPARCSADTDCSLNGICKADACVCDSGWAGACCGELDLLPVDLAQTNGGYRHPTVSTWGGNILADSAGAYHMWIAEMATNGTGSCGLTTWSSNSQITHVSSASPLGPFRDKSDCHFRKQLLNMIGNLV